VYLRWWQEAEQLVDEPPESEQLEEPPSYSQYELDRQRTVVSNARLLLQLAQADMREAPVGCSAVRVAFLERECSKAEARVRESTERELEKVEQHVVV
jgi:hypothetical protein